MATDWKDTIKASFDNHSNRRAEIQTALNKLLGELKGSPYNLNTSLELTSEYPLTWNISIGKKVISINEYDISDSQRIMDPAGYPTKELGDLTEGLKKLLAERFS